MTENARRAIFFDKPDHIPMDFEINEACWHHYPQEWLKEQILRHPRLFPDFQAPELPYTPSYPPDAVAGKPYTDDFGCTWETTDSGIRGSVVKHPLEDWSSFDGYRFPDPETRSGFGERDWIGIGKSIDEIHARGEIAMKGLRHGHTFLQLCDLRGYTNLLYDMIDEEPRLPELIGSLEEFNHYQVRKFADLGADIISFPEDLGMQQGPMLSPECFRKYIKPSYTRMMDTVRGRGLPVHMHSDGDIRLLADDLVDSGVACLNLQDLVNGVDWIRDHFRGRLCIDLDIDRQQITVFGTPQKIDELIRYEIESLACKDGGLMMVYGMYPGTPMKNVEAVMDAMERYMDWY